MPATHARFILPAIFLLLLFACGGGGGDSSPGSAGNATATPTAATTPAPTANTTPAPAGNTGSTPGSAAPAANLTLALQQVVTGLASPIYLTAPTGDARLFIVERPGRIRIVQNGSLLATPFLDISARTTTDGERGLLSMAFDPQFAANGLFYVYYTDPDGSIAIERYAVSAADPNRADPASALRLLSIPHPGASNHNGGLLAFGPDGFLYIGTGDGGGSGDTFGNGQNLNSLLGKLLRIDTRASSTAQPYAIPPANPFINQSGRRPEIWAYGLRNPWRYAFDAAAGLLYIGDVGEQRREEVDVARVDQAGLNYGWNIMEGTLCFASDPCNSQGLVLPVLDYGHDSGCSIIGGYVYRGSAIPELQGRYFYSDLCTGFLKSFLYANGAVSEQRSWTVQNVTPVYSFGQDAQNELYLLSAKGVVYRIVRQ